MVEVVAPIQGLLEGVEVADAEVGMELAVRAHLADMVVVVAAVVVVAPTHYRAVVAAQMVLITRSSCTRGVMAATTSAKFCAV